MIPQLILKVLVACSWAVGLVLLWNGEHHFWAPALTGLTCGFAVHTLFRFFKTA